MRKTQKTGHMARLLCFSGAYEKKLAGKLYTNKKIALEWKNKSKPRGLSLKLCLAAPCAPFRRSRKRQTFSLRKLCDILRANRVVCL